MSSNTWMCALKIDGQEVTLMMLCKIFWDKLGVNPAPHQEVYLSDTEKSFYTMLITQGPDKIKSELWVIGAIEEIKILGCLHSIWRRPQQDTSDSLH